MNQHYNLDDKDYGALAGKVKLIAIGVNNQFAAVCRETGDTYLAKSPEPPPPPDSRRKALRWARGEHDGKSEIQIPEFETISNIQMTKPKKPFGTFENLDFGIVSDFGFRASNFRAGCVVMDSTALPLMRMGSYREQHNAVR
jgi:hypothetical protein